MSLLKELNGIREITEGANFDAMMDLICKAATAAKVAGKPYDDAVKAIMTQFRKLDKDGRVAARWLGNKFKNKTDAYDSSEMSDEALKDLIQGFYNHDKHLSANDNVTNYRDVNFDLMGNGPGAIAGKDWNGVSFGKEWIKPKDDKKGKGKKKTNEDASNGSTPVTADQTGGNDGLDKQQQRGMPAVDPNKGPEGAEKEVPDPTAETPKGTRQIAKSENFSVVLGQNEQVSILDGKHQVRLSMPYVEWKQLSRQ